MSNVLPGTPSLRNQEIHRGYRSQGKNQAELAKEFRLSRPQVSRIIREVEAWLKACPPRQRDLSPEEGAYIAARHSRMELMELERWAREIVEQSLQPQVTITQTLKDNRPVVTQRRVIAGKCDQRMFQHMVDLAQKVVAATEAEIAAQIEVENAAARGGRQKAANAQTGRDGIAVQKVDFVQERGFENNP